MHRIALIPWPGQNPSGGSIESSGCGGRIDLLMSGALALELVDDWATSDPFVHDKSQTNSKQSNALDALGTLVMKSINLAI